MSRKNENEIVIVLGFVLILVIHALVTSALILASPYLPYFNREYRFFFIPASIGLWQIVYVIPLIILMKKKQQWGLMKGVIICAVFTALLSGGCWVFFIVSK